MIFWGKMIINIFFIKRSGSVMVRTYDSRRILYNPNRGDRGSNLTFLGIKVKTDDPSGEKRNSEEPGTLN